MSKPEFHCPPTMREHVERVLQGEYDPGDHVFAKPPRVLDLGANLGAFSIWAARKWPGCGITAFEPHPDNFRLLCQNVAPWPVADCRRAAVALTDKKTVKLYDGANNCGEASLFRGDEQASTFHEVPAMHPEKLPPCDVLKVDTEGAEVEILRGYPHLSRCTFVMLEAHGEQARDVVLGLMRTHFNVGEECLKPTMPERWTLIFKNNEVYL